VPLHSRSKAMPKRSRRSRNKQQAKVGFSPGSIVYTGFAEPEDSPVVVITYSADQIIESSFEDIESAYQQIRSRSDAIHWMRITGLHNVERIQHVGELLAIDPLVLEDVVNTNTRPKHDHFVSYDFITCKLLIDPSIGDEKPYPIEFEVEQLSMILFDNLLVTFHETQRVTFKTILNRIRILSSRHRRFGVDYLAYSIIDTTVDHYMFSLELMSDQIQFTEVTLFDNYDPSVRRMIHDTSMEVIQIRKHIMPFREALWSLYRSEDGRMTPAIKPYMRDVYDHMNSTIDTLEYTRDMVVRLSETYMSTLTLRMNEIVKLLTIISTIFIPLTFIVGVYGMNFDTSASKWNMPELSSPYGYVIVWILMIVLALGMIGYIKRRKWM
jgi:magnesium transporter